MEANQEARSTSVETRKCSVCQSGRELCREGERLWAEYNSVYYALGYDASMGALRAYRSHVG